jgi:hypothetical protein
MPLGKSNTGSGLEIALEGNGAAFVRKCNHNVHGPWTKLRRMNAVARVMLGLPSRDVGL